MNLEYRPELDLRGRMGPGSRPDELQNADAVDRPPRHNRRGMQGTAGRRLELNVRDVEMVLSWVDRGAVRDRKRRVQSFVAGAGVELEARPIARPETKRCDEDVR